MKLDEAREILTAKVDAFVFALGEWQRAAPRDKRASEISARNKLADALEALVGCFGPLIESGALNCKDGPPGSWVDELDAFRAEARYVDIMMRKLGGGPSFTHPTLGGVLTTREVIDRIEHVEDLFARLAHRLEKLIHDARVHDGPQLRAVIADIAKHAGTLRASCQAID